MKLPNKKYMKRIYPIAKIQGSEVKHYVDVYRVLDAFPTGSAAIDHAIKKLLCGGDRGVKDYLTDLHEAIESIEQEIQLTSEKMD